MTKLIFISVLLVIILNTVFSNENLSKKPTNSNDTENNNDPSISTENKNRTNKLKNSKDTENNSDPSINTQNENGSKKLTNSDDTENNNDPSIKEYENGSKELTNSNDTDNNNDPSSNTENKKGSKNLTNSNDTNNNNDPSISTENKNGPRQVTHSNNTENKNKTYIEQILREEYDYRVDTHTNIMWIRFLAVRGSEIMHKVRIRQTTPMGKKPSDVTERIPALIESKEDSNYNVNSVTKIQTFETEDDSTVNDISSEESQESSLNEQSILPDSETLETEVAFNNNETLKIIPDIIIHGDDAANNTSLRRQIYPGLIRKPGGYKFVNIRLPYWQHGDRIFHGTTAKGENVTKDPMLQYNDCNPTCIYYFKSYGKVCGHRYNTKKWHNEYRNFTNLCEMDIENCKHANKRPHWHPMYRGNCFVAPGESTIPRFAIKASDLIARKVKYASYVYVAPTSSMSTTPSLDFDSFISVAVAQTKK